MQALGLIWGELCGLPRSALLRSFGRAVTGLSMSPLFDSEGFEPRRRKMAKAVRDRRHFSVDVMLKKKRSNSLHFEFLGLPVLSKTGARWTLAGIFYHDWAG